METTTDMKHPIQPLAKDKSGVLRFKSNLIVKHMLDVASKHGASLNDLAVLPFTSDDRQQFAQLIGYSLSGYGELEYVDDYACDLAVAKSKGKPDLEARIQHLEKELAAVRNALRKPMARLFDVHPDDLK